MVHHDQNVLHEIFSIKQKKFKELRNQSSIGQENNTLYLKEIKIYCGLSTTTFLLPLIWPLGANSSLNF